MRSLAAHPGWEEQMFPNWHLCCPGVSSSDSVPLPPLALTGVPAPLDLQPQRMEQRWLLLCQCPTWSCCSPGRSVPVERSQCHCWPSPRVNQGQSGLPWPLARRKMQNLPFFSHLFGERRRVRREPRPTAPGGCQCFQLPPSQRSRRFPAHPLGFPCVRGVLVRS